MKYLYFIQRGSRGPIKVGVSEDPKRRLAVLQVGAPEPLSLLGFTPGGRGEERRWHEKYFYLKLRGEWFDPSPEFLEEIFETCEENSFTVSL